MKMTVIAVLTLLLTATLFITNTDAQDARPIVQLVFFRPSDRPVRPNVDAEIDALIKKTQSFFAEEMERHGFGRKTFQFETDAHGNPVVHHVTGKHTVAHYGQNREWWQEIHNQTDFPQGNFIVRIIDLPWDAMPPGLCGSGGGGPYRGGSATIYCWSSWGGVIAHELGHAFGMGYHDFRNANYLMSYSYQRELSPCFAEWLDVHPAFNPTQTRLGGQSVKIQMLSPTLAAPPNSIRLRFTVTAPAGTLLQASLIVPETHQGNNTLGYAGGRVGCRRLHGNPTRSTVEFVTTALTLDTKQVWLSVVGIDGDIAGSGTFPIDIAPLLPPAKVVSIPDPHLAAEVREVLDLSPGEAITMHAMLRLFSLSCEDLEIRSLTGLEPAINLKYLDLGDTAVSDVSPLANQTQLSRLDLGDTGVSDVSALANLTQLETLNLRGTGVSDVSALADLTRLGWLGLDGTGVSDVSALANLTQLQELYLNGTAVSDVSALANLTQLETLWLGSTAVSDVSALANLTQLETLNLRGTGVSDVSALANLTQLTWLSLNGCPLSYASIHTHIPAMQAKGIEVEFDNIAHPALLKVAGDGQEGEPGETLSDPFIVEAQDSHGKPMTGLTVKFTVTKGGGMFAGRLRTSFTEGSPSGIAKALLTLGLNVGTTQVEVTADGIRGKVLFTATASENPTEPVVDAGEGQPEAAAAAQLSGVPENLIPKETLLFANYPNPFNPETWIPYQLANPADVTVTIYAANGAVVRTLALGHRRAGSYASRSRAAYWDGRNAVGERVASGVYFYTLSAGDFAATRKMLILK